MLKHHSAISFGCAAMLTQIAVYLVIIVPLIALWADRNLDFWLNYAKGGGQDAPFWISYCGTVVLSPIVLGANIMSEIARLFV